MNAFAKLYVVCFALFAVENNADSWDTGWKELVIPVLLDETS